MMGKVVIFPYLDITNYNYITRSNSQKPSAPVIPLLARQPSRSPKAAVAHIPWQNGGMDDKFLCVIVN